MMIGPEPAGGRPLIWCQTVRSRVLQSVASDTRRTLSQRLRRVNRRDLTSVDAGRSAPRLLLRGELRVALEVGVARLDLLLGADHVHDGVDQREVREGLGEVAEVAAGARVDLLRVQAERARVGEQLLAQVAGA